MIPNYSVCGRRLYRKVQPLVQEAVAHSPSADRYRKHFSAASHIWVLILHFALGHASLRQSHAQLGADPSVRKRLKLPQWISLSQLARSSSSRQPECLQALLALLHQAVLRTQAPGPASLQGDLDWQLLSKVKALDATFLKLSAKCSPWSVHGGFEPGVKVHYTLELASNIPEAVCLNTIQTNDHEALSQLVEQDPTRFAGWTLLIDLGYYGHKQFERLLGCGAHFLSKLHSQAAYKVLQERGVLQKQGWIQSQDDEVLSDQIIMLGSPNSRRGAVLPGIRLVTSRNPDGKVCRFITDRTDLQGWEVVELYRKRWQIELFFRWLKHQLGAVRVLGTSREAVWLTVLVAGIVALLWLLLDSLQLQPASMSRISWLRGVAVLLHSVITLHLSG